MTKKQNNRGPNPKQSTLRVLCGQAAGMCEFRGCSERLFYDGVTDKIFNSENVAHIISSDPHGPRGDKIKSHQLSNKIENIMLMCAKHHRLIDDPQSGPVNYPVEVLQKMKREHEEKIALACSNLNIPKTEIVNFTSDIHGSSTDIDYRATVQAVLPDRQPNNQYGTIINLYSSKKETGLSKWKDLKNDLIFNFNTKIKIQIERFPDIHFSVFALAPIPLIVKLGELFGDKICVDIFQKTRVPDTWEWQSNELTNSFQLTKSKFNSGKDIALILSLSDEISDKRILSILNPKIIYRIIARNRGVDCIKSELDLKAFWHSYQSVCNEIVNIYGQDCELSLFPAIPVSAAFEVGRRRMPNLYPQMIIYDNYNGFITTLEIGG